jgi:hypothetical protein
VSGAGGALAYRSRRVSKRLRTDDQVEKLRDLGLEAKAFSLGSSRRHCNLAYNDGGRWLSANEQGRQNAWPHTI